jgi:hypothetical protein
MEIDNIVDKYKDKEFFDIIFELEKEVVRLKLIKGRKQHLTDYINSAKEVLFFLQSGIKPAGISDWEFRKMKPLIEKLVEKGNLKKEIMGCFE